jgi:hypothetical protein
MSSLTPSKNLIERTEASTHTRKARPRSTELFPQIMVPNGTVESARQQADIEQIADQLVSTHPASVIRKLRDELSLLLDDLEDSAPE